MIATSGYDGSYDDDLGRNAEHKREKRLSGQNVAPLPPCRSPERREACRYDLKLFCETYFPEAFNLPWSPDHLRVIAKIEDAVLKGTLSAFAMPRGSGKTTISKAATLWAVLFGHRRWPVLIAATGPLAAAMLKNIKKKLTTSTELMADFPEVCWPCRIIKGSALKANSQHHDGEPTFLEWTKEGIAFPKVPGTNCAESRITCFGIEGAIRGQVATLSTGHEIRPDLVLVDDPQTKASAKSESETNTRLEIVMGDILGLAGPTTSIAGLLACTVIQANDLADFVLDPKRAPEWRGERTKLVYDFPKNEPMWEEYFRIRETALHSGGAGDVATDYYRANQAAMDDGGRVAWPERFPPDFASAIEHAMFLRYRSPDVFAAEYQNEPVSQVDADHQFPTAQQIVGKTNAYDRGVVPDAVTYLTGFVDVQQNCLYWAVVGWEPCFTGYVVDYGCFPKQHQSYFSYRSLRHTLAARYPGMGAEAAIFKAINELSSELCSRAWKRPDGADVRIARLLIDSGNFTKTVASAIGQVSSAGVSAVMPSKGRYYGASSVPIGAFQARAGERIGDNWIIRPRSPAMAMSYVEIDTNSWKTFLQLRLATQLGDPGCLSLFKASPYDHRCLADHLTAEKPTRTEGNNRTLYEWKNPPNQPDNHWLDCLTGNAVAASMLGASLAEHQSPATRKRVSLKELAARANGR